MSKQQINLYQDELKEQKLKYSALMLLQVSIVMLMVFSVAAGFMYFKLQQHQLALANNIENKKIVMTDLSKLQTVFLKRKKDPALTKEIIEKEKELTNKQKVLEILNQDELGNTKGFVEHVAGLARQRIEGLWLTQIRIADGGTQVSLQGATSKSSLLPKYLQKLSAEKVFAGTEFKSLLITRQEKRKQWLSFSLQNIKAKGVTP